MNKLFVFILIAFLIIVSGCTEKISEKKFSIDGKDCTSIEPEDLESYKSKLTGPFGICELYPAVDTKFDTENPVNNDGEQLNGLRCAGDIWMSVSAKHNGDFISCSDFIEYQSSSKIQFEKIKTIYGRDIYNYTAQTVPDYLLAAGIKPDIVTFYYFCDYTNNIEIKTHSLESVDKYFNKFISCE
ncbi:hypothetical protein GOV04_00230 [Candidatus Woesearchaeota archaeon]|nr:hypothetical protein [Candidatus Woesearchaeota archaeon]